MNTRKTVLWTGSVLGALLLACFTVAFFANPESQPSPPLIAVSFIGYSNAPDGQVFAQFAAPFIVRCGLASTRRTSTSFLSSPSI